MHPQGKQPQKPLCSSPRAQSKTGFPCKQTLICRFYCPGLSMALTAPGLWLIHANVHRPLSHFRGSNPGTFSPKHQVFPRSGTGTPTVPNPALCSSPKLSTSCQSPPGTPPSCSSTPGMCLIPPFLAHKPGSSCQQRSQTRPFQGILLLLHLCRPPSPHPIEPFPRIFPAQLTEVSPRCNLPKRRIPAPPNAPSPLIFGSQPPKSSALPAQTTRAKLLPEPAGFAWITQLSWTP